MLGFEPGNVPSSGGLALSTPADILSDNRRQQLRKVTEANRSASVKRNDLAMASYRGLAALVGLILLAGCTSSSSMNHAAGDMLPRPQIVVVQDFAVTPDEVRLDPGLSSMIGETLKGTSDSPRTARELEVGRQVASALA